MASSVEPWRRTLKIGRSVAAVSAEGPLTLHRWEIATGKLLGSPATCSTQVDKTGAAGKLQLAYILNGRHLLLGGPGTQVGVVGGGEDGSTMAEPVGTTSPRVDGGEAGATIEREFHGGKFSGRVRVMVEQPVVLSPRPS